MKKFTLLLASVLCVANLCMAQTISAFNFLKASETWMKAPAQTAALSAPVATPATNVQKNQFTANWNAVDGADGYAVQVGRTFETTSAKATMYQLYEPFANVKAGSTVTGTTSLFLMNEGHTFRDWTLYNGTTKDKSVELNAGGQLFTPVMDFSGGSESISIGLAFRGLTGDALSVSYYYISSDEQTYVVPLGTFTLDNSGEWSKRLTYSESITDSQAGFVFQSVENNQGKIEIGYVDCQRTIAANQSLDELFAIGETTGTSLRFHTQEYDNGSAGVTEQFYYVVVAYKKVFFDIEPSGLSNTIIVGDNSSVEGVKVNNSKIFVSDNLHVVLDAPEQVLIYNAAGSLIAAYQGVVGDNLFTLPASGVYVVKAGKTITKVLK